MRGDVLVFGGKANNACKAILDMLEAGWLEIREVEV